MDGLAVKEIERITKENQVIEIEGVKYSPLSYTPIIFEPDAEQLRLMTLSGLVDFINHNVDKLELSDYFIRVCGPGLVDFGSKLVGKTRTRDWLVRVAIDPDFEKFPFGKYLEVEPFVVGLRSMFEASDDLEKVIKYISSVRGGDSFSLDDDGVSQTAAVKSGVSGALTEKETAPAIVKLRPFRTFRDIPQTESEFLFRLKLIDAKDHIVGAALFEADGGRWRHYAALDVKKYLESALPGVSVIA